MTLDRSLVLLRNGNPAGNRSVVLKLIGTRSNRDAYGSWVEAEKGGEGRCYEYASARSYLSASDPRLFIGLGRARALDRLRVHWPSGRESELRDVAPGPLTLKEP